MQGDFRERYRTDRPDYTAAPPRPSASAAPQQPKPHAKKRPKNHRKPFFGLLTLILIIALAAGAWLLFHKTSSQAPASTNPVPKSIKQAVSFPVYYPDTKKLPAGYTFNPASFSTGGGAVEFTVKNGQQKITFTEQTKPSDQDLQQFVSSRIPLNNSVTTPVGTASIGAIGNNTTVSLPTNSSTWILVSAPSNISQSELKTTLNSLIR